MNELQKIYIDNDKEALLNLENTASLLGISSATVRNWVKCGYLKTSNEDPKNLFHLSEVEDIKVSIANGDLYRMQ